MEIENKAQSDECSALKKKLKELNDESRKMTLHQSKSSDNLLCLTSSPLQDKLKKYIEEKEVHIYKKVRTDLFRRRRSRASRTRYSGPSRESLTGPAVTSAVSWSSE